MLHPNHESNHGESFKTFSGLLFLVLLMQPFGALSELICSHQPIVALVGDDVILPCHLEPPISASSETVVWTKPGLDPKYIHVHQDGRLLYQQLNPSYSYRTRLFVEELTNGNVSMKIFRVKISDAGKYFCILQSIHEAASIQLTVGAVSTPIIEVTLNKSGSVVLQCESAGWYPEPEVFWLDGEGKLVSAGPTETVRGPDDLYTVSSRVTVETRHSNNFTCRVQQQNINQTRETHIHVLDDFFEVQSSYSPVTVVLAVSLAVCIVFSSAVVFFVCKWRQKIKTKRSRSEETLMEGNRAAPASSSWLTSWNLYKWFKDEHQRRVEAETKVESLTADVQKLKDEKEKREKQLIKELETKNKELQDEKTRREEAEEEVKNLKTELQTKVDRLTADFQKLKGEKEESEKQLKKELETKNKKLQDEKTRREKAEKQVENLKTELQTKDNSSSSSLS